MPRGLAPLFGLVVHWLNGPLPRRHIHKSREASSDGIRHAIIHDSRLPAFTDSLIGVGHWPGHSGILLGHLVALSLCNMPYFFGSAFYIYIYI